ncbi:MAG: hypothetical protein JWL92_411 [Candidatus Nomurabacteria bacterium]|nr:hypothetical protein [Candidatus Nomurabacteria bacterium]
MRYNRNMKRRHYLSVIIILFALSLWGLISTLNDSLSQNKEKSQLPNTTDPEVPAPAPTVTTEPDVVLSNIADGQRIASPLSITGKAKGNWFFEGSFPIQLTTVDGKVIATGIAQAKDNWMVTSYVPFAATINFVPPAGTSGGYLLLKKDNPSGESRFDKSMIINVQW